MRNDRAEYPPRMTKKQLYRWRIMPDLVWQWRAYEGACDECLALDGKKFFSYELPSTPHPNCKCSVEEAEREKVRRYGLLSGYEDTAREEFYGGQTVSVTLINNNNFLPTGVELFFRMNGTLMYSVNSGILLPGREVTIRRSCFDYEPMPWTVLLVHRGADATITRYEIVS